MDSTNDHNTQKWAWKMNYCRQRRIPPGETWAWEQAGKAYLRNTDMIQKKDGENHG